MPKIAMLAALALLGACADPLSREAEDAVRQRMKDPRAAEVEIDRVDKEFGAVCGKVNGKNSFGAYSGFQGFCYKTGVVFLEGSDLAGYTDLFVKVTERHTKEIEAQTAKLTGQSGK